MLATHLDEESREPLESRRHQLEVLEGHWARVVRCPRWRSRLPAIVGSRPSCPSGRSVPWCRHQTAHSHWQMRCRQHSCSQLMTAKGDEKSWVEVAALSSLCMTIPRSWWNDRRVDRIPKVRRGWHKALLEFLAQCRQCTFRELRRWLRKTLLHSRQLCTFHP